MGRAVEGQLLAGGFGLVPFQVNSVLVEGIRAGLKHRAAAGGICLVVGWRWVAAPILARVVVLLEAALEGMEK